jgi:hypothetical protein
MSLPTLRGFIFAGQNFPTLSNELDLKQQKETHTIFTFEQALGK